MFVLLARLIQRSRNPGQRAPLNPMHCHGRLSKTHRDGRYKTCRRPIESSAWWRWTPAYGAVVYRCSCGNKTTVSNPNYVEANRHGFRTPDAYTRHLNKDIP